MTSRNAGDLTPSQKAHRTAKWARTMTKWLVTYTNRSGARWNLIDFGGAKGSESRGVVDVLAIRKDHRTEIAGLKRGDAFEIVLIQTKGGTSRRPTSTDIERLRRVAKRHHARAIVLAEWRSGKSLDLYQLHRSEWRSVTPEDVFG